MLYLYPGKNKSGYMENKWNKVRDMQALAASKNKNNWDF